MNNNITVIIAHPKIMPYDINLILKDTNIYIEKDKNNTFIYSSNILSLNNPQTRDLFCNAICIKCILIHDAIYVRSPEKPYTIYKKGWSASTYLYELKYITGRKPLHILFGSCFGFYIHEHINILPPGSTIISISDYVHQTSHFQSPSKIIAYIYETKETNFSLIIQNYLNNNNYSLIHIPVIYISKKDNLSYIFDCVNNHIPLFNINPLYTCYFLYIKNNIPEALKCFTTFFTLNDSQLTEQQYLDHLEYVSEECDINTYACPQKVVVLLNNLVKDLNNSWSPITVFFDSFYLNYPYKKPQIKTLLYSKDYKSKIVDMLIDYLNNKNNIINQYLQEVN